MAISSGPLPVDFIPSVILDKKVASLTVASTQNEVPPVTFTAIVGTILILVRTSIVAMAEVPSLEASSI